MQREHPRISRVGRRALAVGGALALTLTGTGTAAFADATNPIAAQEWALNYFNVSQIRKQYSASGKDVIVAVIDSGVDPNQPDLKGRLVDGINLVDPSSPSTDFSDHDSDSHGTAVATVIAGYPHTDSSGNYYGVIGLADQAEIMPIKAGNQGNTNDGAIIAGIHYAIAHGAAVISISQAGTVVDTALTSAINAALAAGVVVVVGTGNDAKTGNEPNTMATVPGVLDVGGIDSNGRIYSESHYGTDVSVAAPANDIEVGLVNGAYAEMSGTSFATPWVSAEAALLIAEHPTWTSGQIVATIIDNTMQVAKHQTSPGQKIDQYVGYGVINPLGALGASEPSSTANPLGGPAITSNPAQNVRNASASASAGSTPGTTATGPGTGTTSPTAQSKSSSKAPLIIVIVVVVVLLIGLLIFLLSRRNRGGKGGGPGGPGGGGGGSNGYAPQVPPGGGQYAAPPQQQQQYPQNSPYPQQQAPQAPYPPQAGGYGQQQNPYSGC